MKSIYSQSKQEGFFDLGIGLGLMLLFGGTAAVISPDNSSQYDTVKQDDKPVVQATKVVKKDQE